MDLSSIGSISQILDSTKSSATSQEADRLASAANNLSSESSDDELKEVLKDFESYFVEQIIKQARDTFTHMDEGSDSTMSQYKDLYMDMAIGELADQIVDDIGGNFTQQLYEQMRRNYGLDIQTVPEAAETSEMETETETEMEAEDM